jgi:hypothetical protein
LIGIPVIEQFTAVASAVNGSIGDDACGVGARGLKGW